MEATITIEEKLVKQITELSIENVDLKQNNLFLKEELAQLKRLIYGRKSEKRSVVDSQQGNLFGDDDVQEKAVEEAEQISYKRKKKKGQPKRQLLPSHLPRKEVVIEPEDKPENAKKIGEEITEILEFNPATLFVIRYMRPKYVDVNEDKDKRVDGVFTGKLPSLPIPKGNAGPGLLAHILISKYIDHLPLHRQIQQLKRQGIHLHRSTMNNWFMSCGRLLSPLYDCLQSKLIQSDYLQGDETPIQVQVKEKKGKTHRGYHWVYHDEKGKVVCFNYRKSRSRAGPKEFLKDFEGALQADGYTVYDMYETHPSITLLACMAHVRRYFFEALDNDRKRAEKVLDEIAKLYKWEAEYKVEEFNAEQIKQHRQQYHLPILESLEEYFDDEINKVLPKSSIGKAIGYAKRLWKRIKRYTENGNWEIDNNGVERKIRPVAIGKKNYMFAGSHKAAGYAAMIYSLLGTCKLNDVAPFEWLKYVLENINEYPINKLEELLPHNFHKLNTG